MKQQSSSSKNHHQLRVSKITLHRSLPAFTGNILHYSFDVEDCSTKRGLHLILDSVKHFLVKVKIIFKFLQGDKIHFKESSTQPTLRGNELHSPAALKIVLRAKNVLERGCEEMWIVHGKWWIDAKYKKVRQYCWSLNVTQNLVPNPLLLIEVHLMQPMYLFSASFILKLQQIVLLC